MTCDLCRLAQGHPGPILLWLRDPVVDSRVVSVERLLSLLLPEKVLSGNESSDLSSWPGVSYLFLFFFIFYSILPLID